MRLFSPGARAALSGASIIAITTTCQIADALKAPGVADVAVTFVGDTVLVVAAPVRPTIGVTANGAVYEGARVRLATSDTTIVAVRGDTLVPKRRGAVTLTATLESSALPRTPPGLTQALIVVADTVTLDSATVRLTSLGDTVTLVATARDAARAALSGVVARWASSDTAVVTVTTDGRLAARGNGSATVRAMVDRDTAAAAVTVAQALVRWTFEPASLRLDALAATGSVTATGRDARGAAIAALAPTAWSVGDPLVLTVSAPGQVTSLLNGATYLYAVRGSVRDSVSVTVAQRAVVLAVTPKPVPPVTSLGAQVQLIARAFDRRGVEIQAARPAWFSLDPAAVRVSTDGLVTALATGSARVVAALDAAADTATVVISNDPASVAIAPDSALATSLGDTLVFRAVARNGRGDSVAATFTWRTPDSAVVQLLADGRALARAVGTARVIATVGSRADTALARVTNVPVAIDITPASRSYASLGEVDTLPVTITNARGAALPRGAVTWTSDDATIARVTAGGIVTARDTGQTVIRATSGLVTDAVDVTVLNVPASIVIGAPATDTLTALGQSLTLPVDVRNARGAPIVNFPVAWTTSSRTTVDTVLPTGEAVAVGWGTTLLVAQAGSVADTMSLTVRNPTLLYVNNAVYQALRVGTFARPYAKIQDGVDAADAGDTVLVLYGLGRYSESVNLVRRIVLLGDATGFEQSGRDMRRLPLISHDTGVAAIRAHTTAPVTIKYLAITHTLDGPAIDADGSGLTVEWVAVNLPGTVTTITGRGIAIANSPSGASVSHSYVGSVTGYGIRVSNVSGGVNVRGNTVDGVNISLSGGDGSGLRLSGTPINADSNVIRRTSGPQIYVDNSADVLVSANDLMGASRLVRLVNVDRATVSANSLRAQQALGEGTFFSYGGIDSAVVQVIQAHGAVSVSDNIFNSEVQSCSPVYCPVLRRDFLSSSDRGGPGVTYVTRNSVHGANRVLFSSNETFSTAGNRADSVVGYYFAAGTDAIYSDGDTVRAAVGPCILASTDLSGVTGEGLYSFKHGLLDGCALFYGPGAIEVKVPNTQLSLLGMRVTGMPSTMTAVRVRSAVLTADSSVFENGSNAAAPVNGLCGFLPCAGVRAEAYSVDIRNSVISGFRGFPGLGVENTTSVSLRGNVVRENRIGVLIGEGVTVASTSGPVVNDVFDNDSAGFSYTGGSPLTLPNEYWWGDGRGPRSGSNLAATGDTIVAANPVSLTVSAAAAPGHTGTQSAALRRVRGDGQSAPASAGAALAKAFTVRVVDADGLPVAGVSVQFSVTGGGGSFGGQGNVTRVTNASGLAEATLTPGTTPGGNTVRVSTGGGVRDITFTATGT